MPILGKIAEENNKFHWNEKIEISGTVASTEIDWNGKTYTVRARLPSRLSGEETKQFMDRQIDITILLMSRFVYGDVSRFSYNERENLLVRTFKNPNLHKNEERVQRVDFLNPIDSDQERVKIKELEENLEHVKVKADKRSEDYNRTNKDDILDLIGKTQNRCDRIHDTIIYGKFFNRHHIAFHSIESDYPGEKRKKIDDKEKEADENIFVPSSRQKKIENLEKQDRKRTIPPEQESRQLESRVKDLQEYVSELEKKLIEIEKEKDEIIQSIKEKNKKLKKERAKLLEKIEQNEEGFNKIKELSDQLKKEIEAGEKTHRKLVEDSSGVRRELDATNEVGQQATKASGDSVKSIESSFDHMQESLGNISNNLTRMRNQNARWKLLLKEFESNEDSLSSSKVDEMLKEQRGELKPAKESVGGFEFQEGPSEEFSRKEFITPSEDVHEELQKASRQVQEMQGHLQKVLQELEESEKLQDLELDEKKQEINKLQKELIILKQQKEKAKRELEHLKIQSHIDQEKIAQQNIKIKQLEARKNINKDKQIELQSEKQAEIDELSKIIKKRGETIASLRQKLKKLKKQTETRNELYEASQEDRTKEFQGYVSTIRNQELELNSLRKELQKEKLKKTLVSSTDLIEQEKIIQDVIYNKELVTKFSENMKSLSNLQNQLEAIQRQLAENEENISKEDLLKSLAAISDQIQQLKHQQ